MTKGEIRKNCGESDGFSLTELVIVLMGAVVLMAAATPSISRLQKERKGLGPGYEVRIFCLVMEREALNARIDARVERMFRSGLVAEVKRLCRKRLSKTASQAIGLHEVQAYVGADTPLAEAKERIKRGTRLYAKRQLTWFRKDKRIRWITVGAGENPRSVTEKIWKELS